MSSELDQFKRRTIAELSHRLERGDLERADYDRRVSMARAAGSPSDLKALLLDLEASEGRVPARRDPHRAISAVAGGENEFVLALMSGTNRSGHW